MPKGKTQNQHRKFHSFPQKKTIVQVGGLLAPSSGYVGPASASARRDRRSPPCSHLEDNSIIGSGWVGKTF